MFYTYVLISKKDGGVYIGQTNNIKSRLKLHSTDKVISTRFRKPFELALLEKYETRSESYKREQYLKSGQGREWLQKYLKDSPAVGGLKNLSLDGIP